MSAVKETRGFETEVKQLLHLMVHSLYSHKEIFLRELISNASDAADKLRYEALSDSTLYEQDSELGIWVEYNRESKTVTIRDNGIGMSREEVIANLGTIARSGTKAFLQSLSGDKAKDVSLIGQFGVGFYSSFMVAERVVVRTRRAGSAVGTGVCWESAGDGEYTLESCDYNMHGTEIVLHLKDGEEEFSEGMRLRHVIRQYSDHINLPIRMLVEKSPGASEDLPDAAETVVETPSYEIVNKATALWVMPKSEITDEQYKEFYKHIAHDYRDPLEWMHNRVEGKLEYVSLLYIPAQAPFDLWDQNQKRGLKLYVHRVFIMEDAEQLLPRYLRFVRGVIDSHDLPLNVSREILQSSKVVDTIRQGIVKRVLSTLETMVKEQPEKYMQFWQNFGAVIKEGPAEDFENRDRIAKLLRFASSNGSDEKSLVSLEAYIGRMKASQEKIYYCAADSYKAAKNSPHLEIFHKKEIEVLFLTDRVDEWLISHLPEFEGKSFQSVARGSLSEKELSIEASEKKAEEIAETDKAFDSVLKQMQTILGDRVKSIRSTQRLTSSPACVVADEHDMSIHMERILRSAGQSIQSKPILEVNLQHPLLLKLQQESDDLRFADLSYLLLDQAILAEGGQLEDPAAFVKRLNEWLL